MCKQWKVFSVEAPVIREMFGLLHDNKRMTPSSSRRVNSPLVPRNLLLANRFTTFDFGFATLKQLVQFL
jgi:hypothetical protein